MKEIINKYIDTFKVTKVKIMNKIEFENNPMIILLPEGAGYTTKDLNGRSETRKPGAARK